MNNVLKKVAILGVGLIGGSIALGLKRHFGSKITILGSCNSIERAKEAKRLGIIDEIIDLHAQPLGLRSVNLIVLAAPVGEIIKLLNMLSRINLGKCLIIDVGSTKEYIINAANQLLDTNISFIGTHPMAGSEMSGFENASVNLFRNKPWLVCPSQNTVKGSIPVVTEIISALGAKPIMMDAVSHDVNSSWASHLSLITSSILVNLCAKQKNWDEIAQIASTGFRDSTRLASDNPNMKTDIVQTNRQNLIKCLKALNTEISSFLELLNKNNRQDILEYFQHAKVKRDEWIQNYFS